MVATSEMANGAAEAEAGTATLLDVRLLGAPEVRVAGEPLPPLRSRKGLWLLTLLCLRAGREVERRWLAGTLWPDSPDETALGNLRRTLTDLRNALGDAEALIEAPTAQTLRLSETGLRCDTADFDDAVERGDHAAAVALYRGPFAEGCDELWAAEERQRRAQEFLAAADARAAALLAAGDSAASAALARRATAADPMREASWRLLMEALARGGSLAAAAEAYRELRTLLRREANAEPDPATTALYRSFQEGASSSTPAAPGKTADVPAPEAPVPAATAAPPAAHPAVHLPHFVSGFVGREAERREAAALLARPGDRLVTLVGPGGVGKTRLAVEAAREAAGADGTTAAAALADGVWFVDLASVADPERVPAAVAAALGSGDPGAGEDATVALCRSLGSRRLLVVMDNCEHVLDACARLADALLSRCPGLRLLATSRQPLGLPGEVVWRVPSMGVPDDGAAGAGSGAGSLEAHDATRLFLERARAAAPGFAPTDEQAGHVVRICRRLDGIPLAIELAAARVRAMGVEQIEARLSDRFRLLTGGSRAALPRQQTLRALIDWSYGLLTEKERALLPRLAVFAGGWTLEAAEQVCADPEPGPDALESWDVADVLVSLVDKSLVAYEPAGGHLPARYRLLETIREYARETAEARAEAQSAVRDRHLAYYAAFADRGALSMESNPTPEERAAWIAVSSAEAENLRAAWARARENGDWERYLQLPVGPWRAAFATGRTVDARDWLEASLATAAEFASVRTRARAHHAAGCLALMQGGHAPAEAHFEKALAGFQALEDPVNIAVALTNLAIIARQKGDAARARDMLEECVRRHRQTGRLAFECNALGNLSRALWELGEREAAYARLEEGLALSRRLGDKRSLSVLLNQRSGCHYSEDRFVEAEADTREALTAAREAGALAAELNAACHLAASVSQLRRDLSEAAGLLRRCLDLLRETGSIYMVVNVLENTALYCLRAGDPVRGARFDGAHEAAARAQGRTPSVDALLVRDELRALLGDAAFNDAFAAGAALGDDAALVEIAAMLTGPGHFAVAGAGSASAAR